MATTASSLPESMPQPRHFLVVAGAAFVFFLAWTWFVYRTDTEAFDRDCAAYWHAWRGDHPGFWGAMKFMTDMGGVAAMTLLTVLAVLWQFSVSNRFLAYAWIGIVIGGALVNVGAKATIDRARPEDLLRDRAVTETNQSYPSGHSMGSMIGFGMLAYTLALAERRRWLRFVTLVACASVVGAIGFSRMYLCAHWFSDVVGGWSIGLAWLALCLAWVETQRR